jgi:hypothetical protein
MTSVWRVSERINEVTKNYLNDLVNALTAQPVPQRTSLADVYKSGNQAPYGLFGLGQAEAKKAAAWAKARPAGLSGAIIGGDVRIDDFGNLIRWQDYGNHTSQYGWEIDHTHPSALGGSDHHSNLRALHCKTNRGLGGMLGNALRGLK